MHTKVSIDNHFAPSKLIPASWSHCSKEFHN